MSKKIVFTALLAVLGQQTALSEINLGSVSPKISTLGIGVEYKQPLMDKFAVSAGFYAFSKNHSDSNNDVKYDAKLKLRHFAILGSYYPWDSGFHFSGGIIFNQDSLKADINPNPSAAGLQESYTFNDVTYTVDDIGTAKIKVDYDRKVAPYLGIGWDNGNQNGHGLSIAASLGAMFTGSPDVNFDVACSNKLKNTSPTACQTLKDNVNAEEKDFKDDLDKLRVYPVLSLGLMYRF